MELATEENRTLYEADFAEWARKTAEAIRRGDFRGIGGLFKQGPSLRMRLREVLPATSPYTWDHVFARKLALETESE